MNHVTLDDTVTNFNIVPVRLTLIPRAHISLAYDGTPQLNSYANQTYGYSSLAMQFWWTSLSAANFIQCQVWSGDGTSITVTDSDTASEYSIYTGLLVPPVTPNSKQKNPKNLPVLNLILQTVTRR